MSRIAKNPVVIPDGVRAQLDGSLLSVKGRLGELKLDIVDDVRLEIKDDRISFAQCNPSRFAHAMSGTLRSLVNNMVQGVSVGFEKRLQLQGVGYRAKASDGSLELALGFSHPINYLVPEGITVETPSQTEISIRGIDKQRVGQVAAEIRSYRPPEPYKGKGVRYFGEVVNLKEVKKK